MLTVTSSDADTTTDRILDAAYDELLHFGVKGVSVEDIAKRVGVARVTIYRRFANKDALLAAVALREGQRLLARVDAALDEYASLEEQVVEGFTVAFQAIRNHPIVKRMLTREPELVTGFLSSETAAIVALPRDYIAAHLAQRRPDLDARPVAELIVRLGASFVLLPDSVIRLKTAADIRTFARTYLVPLVTP
ncbi:MAG TPA: TetR/AcrR family transcriptional regulator [Acidimicrobiales bacterium]|nr:TetR/AcrR family transcriptional regulator [Acidimicrobiales bacterium]